MSLLSILIGEREFQPPPGITRSIRNFKIDAVFLKEEPKPVAKIKEPKPQKPKKKTSRDLKLENMAKIVDAINAGANTQMLIAKRANISRATVSVLTRQLEAEKRISVDHNAAPKKYYKAGARHVRFGKKNFVVTDSMKKALKAVGNGANTQALVSIAINSGKGYSSRILRDLVDNKLIICKADKWPREYYPK